MAPGALFDFDGTLVRGDSMLAWLAWSARRAPWRGALMALAAALGWPLWLHSRGRPLLLSALAWSATVGLGRRGALAQLQAFGAHLVVAWGDREIAWPAARLREHAARGERVWVVSGSSPHWIRPWLAARGLPVQRVLGTRLAFRAGGLVLAERCVGRVKVARLAAAAPGARWVAAYGDSAEDRWMLALAERAARPAGSGEPWIEETPRSMS